ncbi:bifunctional PLP-dependent protein with beta-cystathionase and maltose regulon repressor activities [Intrasporangium oryzae NRRL B-24470]|uniref:cysteine-S-conjugate beta-lyase n=1 Tax=Intrasporangium oryzae NRRL B-24470 TaxID=1386089 RepID=W9GEE3_9MICO|nr:aminotransferase class I/II-fold pyridoxal phosphate-dependent enzyme [Intrasporangium oryzae]EWT03198.1 bifunctional PLP-dependent protein with beta-cystathionase and maltose regulon repressor activities [Intrasporangium oryzae NRRL B-24470]
MTSRILDVSLADLRRDRTSVKWRAHGPDVLPLWIAEMDARPCPAVVEAVRDAVERGDTGYAWTGPYAAGLASFAAAEWGWEIDPATTTRVSDVLGGISHLLGLLTDPGGPVVVSPPVYNAFYDVIGAAGRRPVEAPLTTDGRLDPVSLARAFREATANGRRAAYLLANPHNPTGTTHTPAELEALARLADEHDVRVISDEIHAGLVYADTPFTPYLSVAGSEAGITVTSASKAFNLAGLKAAVIVPGARAVDEVRRLHPFVTYGASHLGAVAQTAAWEHGRDWLHRLVGELDDNRRLLTRLVSEALPGARLLVPEATYLAWLDCRELGLGDDPAAAFLARGRVALSQGPTFGAGGAGFVRINFATSPDILREAVGRMAGCLA